METVRTPVNLFEAPAGGLRLHSPRLQPGAPRAVLAALVGLAALSASTTARAQVAPQPAFHVAAELAGSTDPANAWSALARLFLDATGSLPAEPPGQIAIRTAPDLSSGHAGESRPGLVELRPGGAALRHELAHQFLFWACPAASADRLFHEAFATAAAGEIATFADEGYLSVPAAVRALQQARSLDTRSARRALSRVLSETSAPGVALPASVQRLLRGCSSGAAWTAVAPEQLASALELAAADAAVIVSRHSGEVLFVEGGARRPLPFGSTLKPFVLAGLPALPGPLPARPDSPEWACGARQPALLDAPGALARSCNGWFLDHAKRDPRAHALGAFAEPLLRLGLPRRPASMAEAIGLEPALALTPWALAQAYRLLAEARPDLLEALRETPRVGTLSALPESARLDGLALKTGTVRDARSAPLVGWIVAVDADFVIVRARAGQRPRAFVADVVALVERARSLAGSGPARAQVFGLLGADEVEARCAGVGIALDGGAPRVVDGFHPLRELTQGGAALCLAQPWRVRFAGVAPEGRDHAGVFTWSPPSEREFAPGEPRTDRERRARRGSDFIFRTTRLLYAAGVVEAEAAHLRGEPRAALLRVAAHDERYSRHPGRPVCDTTHCQAFKGTAPTRAGDREALAKPPLPWLQWLHFSAGGTAPWEEAREARDVDAALGAGATALRFEGGRAQFVRAQGGPEGPYDSAESVPCDALRSALKLPSCPERAVRDGAVFRFSGRGAGHGVGLDLSAAEQSGLDQDELLRRAYGEAR
jgi:hypothetical protein